MAADIAHYLLGQASRLGMAETWAGWRVRDLLAAALGINGLVALLVARPIATLLPAPYQRDQAASLFAVLVAAVPFLGLIAAVVIAGPLARLSGRPRIAKPLMLAMPAFGVEMRGRDIHMGAGSAWAVLQSGKSGAARGTRALLALDPRLSRQTSSLARAALRHPQEDLRLLAHGLLDEREGLLFESIETARKARAAARTPAAVAAFDKRLAFLYWELLYQDLSRDQVRTLALANGRHHAEAALIHLPTDAALRILLGRLAMEAGDIAAARSHFEQALHMNTAPGQILPYLAEACFRLRDFAALRRLIKGFPALRDLPTIGAVARFWTDSP